MLQKSMSEALNAEELQEVIWFSLHLIWPVLKESNVLINVPCHPPENKEVRTAKKCSGRCFVHQLAASFIQFSYRHFKREVLLMNTVPLSWDLFSALCALLDIHGSTNYWLWPIFSYQSSYVFPFFNIIFIFFVFF